MNKKILREKSRVRGLFSCRGEHKGGTALTEGTGLNRRTQQKKTIMNRQLILGSLLGLLVLTNGCDHDDYTIYEQNTLIRPAADFIQNNYNLSLFYAAIKKTGMVEELNGDGPFTVFVPDNAAFNGLGIYRDDDFDQMDPDSLDFLVRYHILGRRLYLSDVPVGAVDNPYTNLADKELMLASGTTGLFEPGYGYYGNSLVVNGAYSAQGNRDINVANGVVHMIDKVLKYIPGTVQDFLESRPDYSLFCEGLRKFGLWDQLADDGPWTVMAVTNEVFGAGGLDEEVMSGITPDDYYPRLFSAYLLKKTHLFLSDIGVLGEVNIWYNFPIANDDDFQVQLHSERYSDQNGRNVPRYFANLYSIATGARGSQVLFNLAVQYTDYLVDNGVVHDLTGILITPEQALKTETDN